MAQLVIQTAYPGDLLLSIPLIKQIKKYYPGEEIVLLCRKGLGEIFLKEHLVHQVVEVDKKDSGSLGSSLRELKSMAWQRIFSPHESFRTATWVRSMEVREFSVGFKKAWNWWAFTHRVKKPMRLPDSLRQLSLLVEVHPGFRTLWEQAKLDASFTNPKARTDFSFAGEPPIPEWASMQLRSVPRKQGAVFIAPGSVWPTKMWTKEGFAEVASHLKRTGARVVFVGSPGERELCDHLAHETETESMAGRTTLAELIDLFQDGEALIANDSGAMHAAAVAGLPTVALFGPTVLDFGFRPWQSQSVVVQSDLPCRPCAAHGGKKCPIRTHACMKDLPSSRVIQALESLR